MTSLRSEVEVLKQDERGRVRVPRERRESLLDEFEASGTSGARFARLAGIKFRPLRPGCRDGARRGLRRARMVMLGCMGWSRLAGWCGGLRR